MARPLRIQYEGALYHVTSRGNEKANIYYDDRDREYFLSILKDVYKKHHTIFHAYEIMPNHYHIMTETPLGNLSHVFHDVNSIYTSYFNRRHKRVGHLFQGRYKAILVEKDSYLLELCRYIHLNPIRAKLVKKIEDYPWSSYLAYLGKRPKPEWLEVDWCLSQFGNSRKEAIEEFITFVYDGIQVYKNKNPFDNLFAQTVLGSKFFIEKIKDFTKHKKLDTELTGLKQLKRAYSPIEIVNKVAVRLNVSKEDLLQRKRNHHARAAAIYLSAKHTPEKLANIGKLFNINGTSGVSKAVRNFSVKLSNNYELRKEFFGLEKELQAG